MPNFNEERFLRLPEVLSRVGLSRPHVYRLIAACKFPKPIKLGERAAAWTASSINEWMLDRINESRQAA
jgi:prophage regulatory protein